MVIKICKNNSVYFIISMFFDNFEIYIRKKKYFVFSYFCFDILFI